METIVTAMSISSFFGIFTTKPPPTVHVNLQLAFSPLSSHRLSYPYPSPHYRALTLQFNTAPAHCSSPAHRQDVEVQEEEKVEELIGSIGDELASLERGARMGVQSLYEALKLVDLIQRLGIQRYFERQIERIMDTTHMRWDEKYGLDDAEATVLAFRLLRLQGYPVSAGVLEKLKDENGVFSSFSIETPCKILGMVNLYKCSQSSFPFESEIMGEAMQYASLQLNRALSEGEPSMMRTDNLSIEVRFALEYPRKYLMPRLESRSIIRQLWPSNGCLRKCLQLAKLDLEILQKLHKEEVDKLERWWEEQGVKDFSFARNGVLKSFFAISATIYEPHFSAFRAAFTKSSCLAVLMDDLFDCQASDYDGLSLFNEAVKRWDPSQLEKLPEHKAIFMSLQRNMMEMSLASSKAQGCNLLPFFKDVVCPWKRNMMEMSLASSKAQGCNLLPFFKDVWEDLVDAFAKEAEWRHTRLIPTLKEYLRIACRSIAGTTCIWTSIFLMGERITDEVIQYAGKDSRFIYLNDLVGRLCNDIATFQREAMGGEIVSAVSCYMRENPGCTEKEAIIYLKRLIESACRELESELFASRGVVPECCSKAILNFARTMSFHYKRDDAFTLVTDKEYEELFKDFLYGSLEQ